MEDILKAHLINSETFIEGVETNEIRVRFKKTVQTKQYESEVIEIDTSFKVPTNMTGAERLFISTALQAQLEFEVYAGLFVKQQITEAEFKQRKTALEGQINTIKTKAEAVLGRSIDYLLD